MKSSKTREHTFVHQIPLLLTFTILIPLAVRFFTESNGISLQDALARGFDAIGPTKTGITYWIGLLIINGALIFYIEPLHRSWQSETSCGLLSTTAGQKAMKRLDAIGAFVITLFIGLSISMTSLHQTEDAQALFFQIPWMYRVFEASATGLMIGVLVWLVLENFLFPARRHLMSIFPEIKPRPSSLYAKVFLILAAVVFFLVFQIFATSGVFFKKGLDFQALSQGVVPVVPEFLPEHGANEVKGILSVFYFRTGAFLFFVLQLMFQVKIMITRPLDIIRGRLSALNSENQSSSREIQIIQNDEFSRVYIEINKLIQRQQRELTVSKDQLDSITDSAADPIIVYDAEGRVTLFNPAAEAYFNCPRSKAMGSTITELIELDNPSALFMDGDEGFEGLLRMTARREDGLTLVFEAHASRVVCEERVEYTVVLRDIKQQVELEETLTKAKLAAETANRMKSEFLATMSHELRTPLNAVLGFTQLLSGDKNLTASQVEKIGIINRSGEHLLALINDILDISKIEAGKMEMHETIFDLVSFVRDIQDMFELKCKKKGLNLYVENVGELPRYVQGDLGKLRQVLINLVGNAVKFTSEGGIGITLGNEGGLFRFSITDSGRGIPQNEISVIMEPFTQSSLTDNEGGTGLGLAISKRFITMMGGTLEIQSEVGKGSVFSFAIPLPESVSPPEALADIRVPIAVKEGQERLVLLVDDRETNRMILKEMLEGVGFVTMEAQDGQEAVERAKEFVPQLILMDIRMPRMDGYEAVKRIKADPHLLEIPVFALTASAFRHDEEEIAKAGFDGFLAKPFKKSALFHLLASKTKIVMEYETSPITSNTTTKVEAEIPWSSLAKAIPGSVVDDLKMAASINDFAQVGEIAQALSTQFPEFASLLNRCALDFDEEGLSSVIKKLEIVHD